jgi:uncharacterized membrane protein HdeD (DUF308 family)
MMLLFVRTWQALALRGAVGVLFGVCAFVWPSITLTALTLMFGAYALTDGALAIAAGLRHPRRETAWMFVFEGLVGVGVGLAAFVWTGRTTLVLVNLIALWAIVTGAIEVVVAVRYSRELPGEVLLAVAGIASIVLGLILWIWPRAGTLLLVAVLGSYALFFGTTMLLYAFRIRRLLAGQEHGERLVGPTRGAA